VKIVALLAAVVLAVPACGSSGGPSSAADATVAGRVVSAPSCPVEREGSPCPPRPVSGGSVVALSAGRVIASTHTSASGRFRLRLQPGRYLIRATNVGGLATTAEQAVVAESGITAQLTLTVDSGIR
jgi:hypothetical protein